MSTPHHAEGRVDPDDLAKKKMGQLVPQHDVTRIGESTLDLQYGHGYKHLLSVLGEAPASASPS
jgi:hypothetical protein